MVDTMALKGVHHCIKSGMLAAESIYAALTRGSHDLSSYEDAIERSSVGKELWEVRNARQPLQKGLIMGAPLSGVQQITKGKLPGRADWHRNDAKPMFIGKTKDVYPKPDGKYIFDKLSSVFITGNAKPGAGCAPRASTRSPRTPLSTARST
jgi:electron-transferring-flavoprotein dehydrogenase